MKIFFSFSLLLICISCGKQSQVATGDEPESTAMSFSTPVSTNTADGQQMIRKEKTQQGVRYRVRVVSALEFIARRSRSVAAEDRKELSESTVLLLDFELNDENKNIWESTQLKLSKDDAQNYLIGEIVNDLYISQNNKDIYPAGVNFEGSTGAANQIRVVFFLDNIALNKPMTVSLYDKLFGAGLMKFGIQQPTNHQ